MFRGYRLALCAAFGWLSLGAADPPDKGVKSNKAESSGQIERAAQAIATAIRETIQRPEEDGGCEKGQDYRKSDLCAQWKAADAARDAAEYAFWTMLIGTLGTGLLVWTFWETRLTARRQLRAYLDFSDPEMVSVGYEHGTERYETRYKIQNFGETPAFNIRSEGSLKHVLGVRDHQTLTKSSDLGALSRGDDIRSSARLAFRVGDIERLQSGKQTFSVHLLVTYNDAFGVARSTCADFILSQDMKLAIKSGSHRMT